jgi:hypothetical protein
MLERGREQELQGSQEQQAEQGREPKGRDTEESTAEENHRKLE